MARGVAREPVDDVGVFADPVDAVVAHIPHAHQESTGTQDAFDLGESCDMVEPVDRLGGHDSIDRVGAIVIVVAAFAIAAMVNGYSRAEIASWRLDPSFAPRASSTEIPILVFEAACASGRPTTGRMEVEVAYSASSVTIGIKVKPLGGDQDCQAVQTRYVVGLREPLGDRELVDANARTP